MAAFYHTFTTINQPDPFLLVAALRLNDPVIGYAYFDHTYRLKKSTSWTFRQINEAQQILDTTVKSTPQLLAQQRIDIWPLEFRALVMTFLDIINELRIELRLPIITLNQTLNSIRIKAGQ
jgi:hypothetical protein